MKQIISLAFIFTAASLVNLQLAGLLTYYALKNARMVGRAVVQSLVSAGALLLVIAGAIIPLSSFVSLGVFTSERFYSAVFVIGASVMVMGFVYSWIVVRKLVGRFSILKIMRRFSYGIYRLIGSLLLLFFVIPFWARTLAGQPVIEIFGVLAALSSIAVLTLFTFAERKISLAMQSSAVATGTVDDGLLRRDLRTFRAYSELTSRFSSAAARVTGVEFLREALGQVSEEHEILKGCELSDNGFLKISKPMEILPKMDEQKSLPKIITAFSELNARFIDLYAAATSRKVAKRTFENAYRNVKEKHGTLETFPDMVKELPPGFLEDEKLAFSRKEELERMVRERTAEMERTINELERVELGLSQSEKRFKGMVSLLPEPVFETDKSGNLTFLNMGGYDALGYSPKDLDKGLNVLQLLTPRDRDSAKKIIGGALGGGMLLSAEYTALGKDGETFPVLLRVSPIIYADRPVGLRGVLIDTSDRKRVRDIEHRGLIDVLEKLKRVHKVGAEPVSGRIRQVQRDAIDVIKKELTVPRRPSPIIEAYRELLGKPRKKPKRRLEAKQSQRKKTGKKKGKREK